MKHENAEFLTALNRRKAARRRTVSLLLVLSMLVSSGVSWALHGIGMTMANEPETEAESPPADGTETEESAEGGEDTGADSAEPDEAEAPDETETADAEPAETDAESAEEDAPDEEESEIIYESVDGYFAAGDGESGTTSGSGAPQTIETIDNIAEGIHFTLFDYGDDNVESQLNNYYYQWDSDNDYYTHPNVRDVGINAGKNATDDILFLAYGTAVPFDIRERLSNQDGETVYNYIENGIHYYKADKNSYAGDYNADSYYSGNRPVSGIVEKDLGADGYPHIAQSRKEDNSLAYLFDPSTSAYKSVYSDVNHLLKERYSEKGTRYLTYDSNTNYAYYDETTGNFEVYDRTFDIINDNHHADGDVNNIRFDSEENPIKYSGDKDKGFKIGFFPFDEYDENRRDPNYDGNGYNHHFGMTMNAVFQNPNYDGVNVKEPITFKYSGDDDMWVYVDGRLVLDIGGIHEPTSGMIDFSNGLVWVQDNGEGKEGQALIDQMIEDGLLQNADDYKDLPKPIGINTASNSVDGTNRWKVSSIASLYNDPAKNIEWQSEGKHEIKLFYLERGGCYSNLAMEMNLPTLKPLSVIKNVDYQDHLVKDEQIDNKEYRFCVYEWDEASSVWVKCTNDPGTKENPNPFYLKELDGDHFVLKAGERKTFPELSQTRRLKVVEEGIDPNVYDQVSVTAANNTTVTAVPDGAEADPDHEGMVNVSTPVVLDADSLPLTLKDVNSYTFDNRVIQEPAEVTVKKVWDCDPEMQPENYEIKYRIKRIDLKNGEEKIVALRDPETGKKQRVFTLNTGEADNGSVTITGLAGRYGDHEFKYKIEELNTPDGFKVSYSDDGAGGLTMTNTDISKVELHVRKDWNHVPEAERPEIRMVLKRKKIAKLGNPQTKLTVNILDEAGNLIQSKLFNQVYTGGGVEVEYILPQGCELYHYEGMTDTAGIDTAYPDTYPQKNPTSPLNVKFETDENIVVVSNLAQNSNTVSFKVTTGSEKDELLLMHHSFTRSINGWSVQNDPSKGTDAKIQPLSEVPASGLAPYAKGDALLVSNRTKSFNGPIIKLDPAKFKMNKTYTFSTYVYYNDPAAPETIDFKFTFDDGLQKANNGSFHEISNVTVRKGEWTQLVGTVTFPEDIDPYNLKLLVETIPDSYNASDGDRYENPKTSSFLMDELTAVENRTPISVGTDGKVSVSGSYFPLNTEEYYISFNNTTGDWVANGNARLVANGHDTDNHLDYVTVAGRRSDGDGMKLEASHLTFLQKGHTYRFESTVQGDGANNINSVQLSLDTINGGNWQRYQHVGPVSIVDGTNRWHVNHLDGTMTIPQNADLNNMYLYYETEYNSNQPGNFRVLDLKITDITPLRYVPIDTDEAAIPDGYKVDGDHYLTDYSNYVLSQVPNTVTNPLHLATDDDPSAYTVEEVETFTLNAGDDWKKDWEKSDLIALGKAEETGYIYEYWIEELKVGNSAVQNPADFEKAASYADIRTADDEYLVTYDGNFVATNTAESPFKVTNTAIWYRLPDTGGVGTDTVYGAGVLLIVTGLMGGCALRKRERRYR